MVVRGMVDIKGKGQMTTYLLVGNAENPNLLGEVPEEVTKIDTDGDRNNGKSPHLNGGNVKNAQSRYCLIL